MNIFKEVPKKKRLSVYKKTLRSIKNLEYKSQLVSHSLCLLLPSILWGLNDYMDDAPDGKTWFVCDAKTLFPELTNEVIFEIDEYIKEIDKNKIRINYLEQWISQLS